MIPHQHELEGCECMYLPQHIILDTEKENNDDRILDLIMSAFPTWKKPHHKFTWKR